MAGVTVRFRSWIFYHNVDVMVGLIVVLCLIHYAYYRLHPPAKRLFCAILTVDLISWGYCYYFSYDILSVFRKLSCSVPMLRNMGVLHETVDVESGFCYSCIHYFSLFNKKVTV